MAHKLSPGAETIQKKLTEWGVSAPLFHVVLGSGFKDALDGGLPPSFQVKGEIRFTEVPGLYPSTAPGHAGKYVLIEHTHSKKTGVIQVGRLHGYEGIDPRDVVRTVLYTRELGTTDYFITNAAGGMGDQHEPGDVMVITDQINLTGKSPLYGENPKKENGEPWGPRFQDLTSLFHREWRELVKAALAKESLRVHEGVYMGVLGPAFETPAEIRFFKQIGAHSVGMSTVWETVALRHTSANVCAMSLISNIGAGLRSDANGEPEVLDHFAILDACKSSSVGILSAILKSVEKKYGI